MNQTTIGTREETARIQYAAGEVEWDAVITARGEDEAAARAAADEAARQAAADQQRRAEESARAQEEAERRAAKERERREAAPRKRLSEIRAACAHPLLSVKDLEEFAKAKAVVAATDVKAREANRRRDALEDEYAALCKEIEGGVTEGCGHRRLALDALGVVVDYAFRTKSWQATAKVAFGSEHNRLPGSPLYRDLFISSLKAVKVAGGPDIVPSRRELDAYLDPPGSSSPVPNESIGEVEPGTLGRIGKSIKDAFVGGSAA